MTARPTTHSRPPQRRVTPELCLQLVEGYEAGQTTYELAAHYGFNRSTIAMHLRQAGVSIRMDGMTVEQIERAAAYYRDGWSLARIGSAVSADAETVRKRLRKIGVAMRR